MTAHLFIIPPDWSLVLEITRLLKLPDFGQEFKKSDLDLSSDVLDEIALSLSPYYRPCYRDRYLSYLDSSSIIYILKQILLPHGYIVSGRDTTRRCRHVKFYKLIPLKEADSTLPSAITISFD